MALENSDVMMYTNVVHRTQIMLEERQYAALKAMARRRAMGISALIRLALDRFLGSEKREGRGPTLESICGIGRDPRGPSSDKLDEFLYGGPEGPL